MLVGQKVKRILLAQYRVDFRKSFDGLTAEAYGMGLNVLEGDAILFFSRDNSKYYSQTPTECGSVASDFKLFASSNAERLQR